MSDDFDINKILEEKANSMEWDNNRDQNKQNIGLNTQSTNENNAIENCKTDEIEENSLLEETCHVIKKLRDYETCISAIKKEADGCHDNPDSESDNIYVKVEPENFSDVLIVPERDEVRIKDELCSSEYNNTEERSSTEDLADKQVKFEQTDAVVSYDFPQFDGQSISSIGSALEHVETHLDDEVNIKNETEMGYDDLTKNCDVKCEPECIDGANLPTENLPQNDQNKELPNGDENEASGFDSLFQLNSITGNCMSLEDEAFGLKPASITGNCMSLEDEAFALKPAAKKQPMPKTVPCPRCTNMYRNKSGLKRHLEVHSSIDRYHEGRKRGREKIIKATKLRKGIMEGTDVSNVRNYDATFKYLCTCGKRFKRRTTMESCLRSHDEGIAECSSFTCIACNKHFKDKNELTQHRKRLHSRKKFPCKFCPTEFSTQRKLVKHLRKHKKVQLTEFEVLAKVGKLKCPVCKNGCTDFSGLKTHITAEHKPPYQCRKCCEKSNTILDFTTHLKSKHSDSNNDTVLDALEAFSKLAQEWKCEDCHVQFNNADELALHKLEQHTLETKSSIDAETQFQCVDCRRVFASAKSLNSHRRIQHIVASENETLLEICGILCIHCRKVCKDDEMLTSHMRFHSPDRKYVCKYCDFRFATPEKRKAHAEIHTGDLKFVCFMCEYQCSSFQRLTKHKRSVKHLSMKDYLINVPVNGAHSTEDLKSEALEENSGNKKRKVSETNENNDEVSSSENEAGTEFACDICEAKFSSHEVMLEHKQTHPFIEFPNDDKPTRIFFK